MLGEVFLQVQRYREERRSSSASKQPKNHTDNHGTDQVSCILSSSDSAEQLVNSTEEDLYREEPQGLRVEPPGPVGLPISGSAPVLPLDQSFSVRLDDCSILAHYPDLQVADSGWIPNNLRAHHDHYTPVLDIHHHAEPHRLPSLSDQGYLVMGHSVDESLGLPGSGLGPMSNSLLNGLLEKQLDEVYMQHLTDSLARCHSQLGNSLLHRLVPPQGPVSLESSLEVQGPEKKISYLSTQNLGPCSSHFSTPVLRISENENIHQK